MAYVNRPAIVRGPHTVTTDDLVAAAAQLHASDPHFEAFLQRTHSTGVNKRCFTRPIDEVLHIGATTPTRTISEVCRLGELAARSALEAADLQTADLGGVIMFSTDPATVRGLDDHLEQALQLPVRVRRWALASLGPAGGAQALGLAADDALLGRPILVLGAEAPSTTWCAETDDTPASLLTRLLCSDGAAAALVSATPLSEPTVYIQESWQWAQAEKQLPIPFIPAREHTFDATSRALSAISETVPHLPAAWTQAAFGLIHPGSTAQLDALTTTGSFTEEVMRPARESLAEDGNAGGSGVLYVLDRIHRTPPPIGAAGILFSAGPGFTSHAAQLCWVAS
ncbi:hypothetical protein ACFWZ2_40215 [Streptomyces sp. NPDC059002]|uniref:hypothetical protein n=1 Tax=Streptomyces sp. NPDC059002 TaxID=3346690 RepID=UPI00369C398E